MKVLNCVFHLVVAFTTFQSIEAWYEDFQISQQDPNNLTVPGDGCDASLMEVEEPVDSHVIYKNWIAGALWLQPHNCASMGNRTRDVKMRKNLVRIHPNNKNDVLYCCTENDFDDATAVLRNKHEDANEIITSEYFNLDKCFSRDREFRVYDQEEFYKTEIDGPIRDSFGIFDRFDKRNYDHAVAVGWSSGSKVDWNCTGVLITPKFVLTSAKCASKKGRKPDIVRLGTIDLKSEDKDMAQNIPIANITKHPQYKKTLYYYDIAVIELLHNIKKSYFVLPACIQTIDQQFELKKQELKAVSYNQLYHRKDLLMQTDVELLDAVVCNEKFKNSSKLERGLAEGQLCAKTVASEYFSQDRKCRDNGGGPIQLVLEKNMRELFIHTLL